MIAGCPARHCLPCGCPTSSNISDVSNTALQYMSLWRNGHRAQRSMAQRVAFQHSPAQLSAGQHSTAQHSTAQHSTAQHSTAQHSTAQHSTAQHSTAYQGTSLVKLTAQGASKTKAGLRWTLANQLLPATCYYSHTEDQDQVMHACLVTHACLEPMPSKNCLRMNAQAV